MASRIEEGGMRGDPDNVAPQGQGALLRNPGDEQCTPWPPPFRPLAEGGGHGMADPRDQLQASTRLLNTTGSQ